MTERLQIIVTKGKKTRRWNGWDFEVSIDGNVIARGADRELRGAVKAAYDYADSMTEPF